MMCAYGEFRWGFNKDTTDTRMVHYGMRDILEKYLLRRWTLEDLEQAGAFYATHCALGTHLEWPKDLFTRVVTHYGGYFPLKLEVLKEGTCTNARVPVYQITTKDEFAPLCTFFETVLTHVWYASTVATLSRRARDVIEDAFATGAEGGVDSPLLPSRLHDFGMRGCTTGEQSIIGGCAHLLNFEGTDTMPAAFHAQFHLNGGRPVGFSIPASVRSSFPCRCALSQPSRASSRMLCCDIRHKRLDDALRLFYAGTVPVQGMLERAHAVPLTRWDLSSISIVS